MDSVALETNEGGIVAVIITYDPGDAIISGIPNPSAANFSIWVDGVEKTITYIGWFDVNDLEVVCSSTAATSSIRVRQDVFDANVRNMAGVHAVPPQEITYTF
jgi:hypothetical protein